MKDFYKFLCVIIATIIIAGITCVPSYAILQAADPVYDGIDVSQWQGYIDFAQVKAGGIDVVYIKASEGNNFVDPYFETHYENARANGLDIGFYHYLTATTVSDAQAQARFFASVISGKTADCKLAMDFEQFDRLVPSEINEISEAFLSELTRLTNKETVIYSDLSNAQNIFDRSLANQYPLWLAYYGNYPELGRVNASWNEWVGVQYTDQGKVSGINGVVDRNRFTKFIFLSDASILPDNLLPDESANETNTVIYIVRRGDTLSGIAKRFETTINQLVILNNIRNPNLIFPGETLKISKTTGVISSDVINYTVRKEDTLSRIAQRYRTTVSEIVALNNNIQNPNLIFPGEQFKIITNTININTVHETNHIIYTIKRGDSLWKIAQRYETTVQQIVILNNIQNPNLIFPGERLKI